MLKMFSTQISGLFKKIMDGEEFSFEDCARLLAQASIGDGTIYIHGFGEMQGILAEALGGAEPFLSAMPLYDAGNELAAITSADRVLVFTRHSNDSGALQLARQLQEQGIPFTAVSTLVPFAEHSLDKLADVHMDLRLQKGLLPDDSGNRVGFPTLIAALFVYYGIKFTLDEILQEYSEE
ncbi:DUF2529 family protein [Peribacillus cavernae]|uniref:DUF2529 family protein n=1 Tax=Peribacillus cavernae TaxID=1674310 RepID=A0A433HTF6_9BACI|nr:DUF2529 domain-containing protein [Peribacillus cavernae]MDQ0218534.1 DNA-binding MurR/RpiR family transcriptional regulator [Peribacillus cavernae]RUQ31524.1 DUF2529 family protein [Peribacillus cavernae]